MNPLGHLPATVFWLCTLLLLMAITISTPLGAMLTAALFAASMQLAAMWAVHGPASYLRNSFWSLLGSFAIGFGALVGCFLGTRGMITVFDSIKLMSFGPIIWCVAQLPYWALRLLLNWQIRTKDDFQAAKVSIKDIMGYTVFIALSLTLLQFGYSPGNNYTGVQPEIIVYQFLIPITMMSWITFLLVCLPAIHLLFSPDVLAEQFANFWAVQGALIAALFFLMLAWEPTSALLFVVTVAGFSACFGILICVHRSHGLFLCRDSGSPSRLG